MNRSAGEGVPVRLLEQGTRRRRGSTSGCAACPWFVWGGRPGVRGERRDWQAGETEETEGRSECAARAKAMRVSENPGEALRRLHVWSPRVPAREPACEPIKGYWRFGLDVGQLRLATAPRPMTTIADPGETELRAQLLFGGQEYILLP